MRKTVLLVLLTLLSGSALAQGLCRFTYNPVSRKVDMRCEGGMASAPLGVHERALLASGKAKVCTVRPNPDQMKRNPKAGLFESECR